jgi:hypothetical protein
VDAPREPIQAFVKWTKFFAADVDEGATLLVPIVPSASGDAARCLQKFGIGDELVSIRKWYVHFAQPPIFFRKLAAKMARNHFGPKFFWS